MVGAFRSSMVVLVSWLCLLAGCDEVGGMAESEAHGRPIAAEIENAVGKRPHVASSRTGPILVVIVRFSEVPSMPLPSLEPIVRAAIVHEFKKEPTNLTISFDYDKSPFELQK